MKTCVTRDLGLEARHFFDTSPTVVLKFWVSSLKGPSWRKPGEAFTKVARHKMLIVDLVGYNLTSFDIKDILHTSHGHAHIAYSHEFTKLQSHAKNGRGSDRSAPFVDCRIMQHWYVKLGELVSRTRSPTVLSHLSVDTRDVNGRKTEHSANLMEVE